MKLSSHRAVVAQAFSPRIWEGRQVDLCEFKVSLVYTTSYLIERPCIKTKQKQKNLKQKNKREAPGIKNGNLLGWA